MQFRRNGKVVKGILFGALAGFAMGGISGLIDGDDEDCSSNCRTAKEKAKTRGKLFVIPGALLGGIFGAIKIHIPIYGDQETFKRQKEELLKYKRKY